MESFELMKAVAQIMGGFPQPWYVAGGWAIDLFLGQVTRDHEDIEVAVWRRDQQLLHDLLTDWTWQKASPRAGALPDDEREIVPWRRAEWLELPIHQVFASRAESVVQGIDFFLNEAVDGQWLFRRNLQIRRPEVEVGLVSSSGIPIVAPDIMLAYKAKLFRAKDEHDFAASLPLLQATQRAWLKKTLITCHPEHPWITHL